MKRLSIALALLALLLGVTSAASAQKKDKDDQTRSLHGLVGDVGDNPLEKAVVYLKNTRTLQVRTFITPADGNYHFYGLSPNVDYEVRAEHNGVSSPTRTLSSFDGRRQVYLNLKIEAKK
jgi:hypothetical protein